MNADGRRVRTNSIATGGPRACPDPTAGPNTRLDRTADPNAHPDRTADPNAHPDRTADPTACADPTVGPNADWGGAVSWWLWVSLAFGMLTRRVRLVRRSRRRCRQLGDDRGPWVGDGRRTLPEESRDPDGLVARGGTRWHLPVARKWRGRRQDDHAVLRAVAGPLPRRSWRADGGDPRRWRRHRQRLRARHDDGRRRHLSRLRQRRRRGGRTSDWRGGRRCGGHARPQSPRCSCGVPPGSASHGSGTSPRHGPRSSTSQGRPTSISC